MLTSLHLHMKSNEVCIKTRSPPASLPIQGQVTKHTTVKWAIELKFLYSITMLKIVTTEIIRKLTSWRIPMDFVFTVIVTGLVEVVSDFNLLVDRDVTMASLLTVTIWKVSMVWFLRVCMLNMLGLFA